MRHQCPECGIFFAGPPHQKMCRTGDALISDAPGPFESRLRERGNLIIALGGPDMRRA